MFGFIFRSSLRLVIGSLTLGQAKGGSLANEIGNGI